MRSVWGLGHLAPFSLLSPHARSCQLYIVATIVGMVNPKEYNLIEGKKYRIVTAWGVDIMIFRGVIENGNPTFVRDIFPVQGIPWQAIESIEPMEK